MKVDVETLKMMQETISDYLQLMKVREGNEKC